MASKNKCHDNVRDKSLNGFTSVNKNINNNKVSITQKQTESY